MIICKLSEILGRKRLKISKVIKDTKISRPTLTSLYYSKSKGINFDTLSTLCSYLSVTPNELLVFYDIDIKSKELIIGTIIDFDEDKDEDYDGPHEVCIYFNGSIEFDKPALKELKFHGTLDGNQLKGDNKFSITIWFETKKEKFLNIVSEDYFDWLSENIVEDITNRLEHMEEFGYTEIEDIYSLFTEP